MSLGTTFQAELPLCFGRLRAPNQLDMESTKVGLLAAEEAEEKQQQLEMADAKAAEKQKRMALEAAVLEDMQVQVRYMPPPQLPHRGILRQDLSPRTRNKFSFRDYQPRPEKVDAGARSASPGKERGFGAKKEKRSSLSKWFNCFKVPAALLSHKGPKNTSCTVSSGDCSTISGRKH